MGVRVTDFIVEIKDEKKLINLDGQDFLLLELNDSIFDPFPFMSFIVMDRAGDYLNNFLFPEGLKVRVKMGYVDEELEHDFYWSLLQVNQIEKNDSPSGQVINQFNSYFKFEDIIPYKVWKQKTIDEIIRNIMNNEFTIRKTKNTTKTVFTSPSNTRTNWYSGNLSYMEFIKTVLCKYSLSVDSFGQKSTYLPFFNLDREFHCQTIGDLFNQSVLKSLDNYTINFAGESSTFNDKCVQDWNIQFIGYPFNGKLYNPDFHYYNYNKVKEKETHIENFNLGNSSDSLFPMIKEVNDIKLDSMYLGIFNKEDNLKALINYIHRNSSLQIRLTVSIHYNRDAQAGRLFKLTDVKTPDDKLNQLFVGEWLILSSKHTRKSITQTPGTFRETTTLTLGKNYTSFKDNSKVFA